MAGYASRSVPLIFFIGEIANIGEIAKARLSDSTSPMTHIDHFSLELESCPDSASAAMHFAYADPPYLGQGKRHYGQLHKDAADCDKPQWHATLIRRLSDEYPDGWAMSASSTSLRLLLPLCPQDVRVGAWVKPVCSFKPNVNPAYSWEPVIWRGGRKRRRWEQKVLDHTIISVNMQHRLDFVGAKSAAFVHWLIRLLNIQKQDQIDDLFPGSGAVTRHIQAWKINRTFWE
jgi:hypothetical protein